MLVLTYQVNIGIHNLKIGRTANLLIFTLLCFKHNTILNFMLNYTLFKIYEFEEALLTLKIKTKCTLHVCTSSRILSYVIFYEEYVVSFLFVQSSFF